jgi:AcrR family transcriptional regulator
MAALAVSLAPGSAGVQPGAQRFERERVNEIQRSRLLAAAGQVCCERGAANMTVGLIVERAGVSRRTFYELYRDSEECLLAVFDDALERARERVIDAWSAEQRSWRERTRSSLVALLGLFDEDPVLARLLVVESLAAGHRVLADRAHVLDKVIDALTSSLRRDGPGGKGLVPSDASESAARLSMEGAVGGVLGLLHARISQRSAGRLIELTSTAMSMLVIPYDGLAAARREAQRPAPEVPAGLQDEQQAPVLLSDPFKDAGMRLTYRTMRVLCAIGETPGLSNRRVAALAEVGDQGQVSKLLARLERLGMIANAAADAGKGEANAWTLTPAGRQVTNRIKSPISNG